MRRPGSCAASGRRTRELGVSGRCPRNSRTASWNRAAPRGDLARTTGTPDEFNHSRRRFAPLLGGRPMQVGHPWQRRGAKLPTELGEHRSPAVEHRALWCIAGCASRPVPVEPLEFEDPCTESENPALDGARSDADAPCDARQGNAIGECLGDGIQNDLDTGDLARSASNGSTRSRCRQLRQRTSATESVRNLSRVSSRRSTRLRVSRRLLPPHEARQPARSSSPAPSTTAA